jgi:hypothetical protein
MQGFKNFKDQIGNSHFQPQNSVVSIRRCSSSSYSKHRTPTCKEGKESVKHQHPSPIKTQKSNLYLHGNHNPAR